MDDLSLTSLNVAAHRAIETERDGALFADPFARRLAGDAGFRFAQQLARASSLPTDPEQPTMFALRTRFYDDALVDAVAAPQRRQVVICGAGMDTRAFRMTWPDGTRVFELDRDAAFAHKEPLLAEARAVPRCARVVVIADLRERWDEALRDAGFRAEQPTIWVAEGLLYYLPDADVHRFLDDTARLASAGSVLVTDVAPTVMRDLDVLQSWRDLLAAHGEPFRSFTDDGTALLADHGWMVTSASSIASVAAACGYAVPAVGSLGARRLLVAGRA